MKINSIVRIFIMVTVIFLSSCGDDDGILDSIPAAPPRLLSEVAVENDAEIRTYLETHFYNYEEFENSPEGFDFQIIIDTISGDNANKTALIQQVTPRTIDVSSFEFLLNGESDIEHTYYILEARAGEGAVPTIADSTFVRYEASLLNGEVFDAVRSGIWWDNPSFQFPGPGSARAFRGVAEGVTNLASGTGSTENGDGTFDINNFGVGMMIFPSALGTFNGFRDPIPQYSPLIFKFDVLATVVGSDHDNDGIPSLMEDLNSNGILPDDNTDGDIAVNYLDSDDDNDGIPTRDEIEIAADGTITFPDSDNDGTPDYLDSDS